MTEREVSAAARPLGELEAAVMQVIWDGGPCTIRGVLAGLRREPEPAYTTVQTIMGRLVEKGLLERQRSGRVDVYGAVMGREEFERRVAQEAVRGLVDEYGEAALAQFAAALEGADPERVARLRERFGHGGSDESGGARGQEGG